MAEREPAKVRKRAVKPAALPIGRQPPGKVSADLGPQIAALEAERDALKVELAAAQARLAELERSREQVLNRIDWVIDSLHNLIEE